MDNLKNWFQSFMLCGLLLCAMPVLADEVLIYYIDDAAESQILTIDANASEVDNALAATLILEGSNILVILDEKEDLEVIAAAVSAKAPDSVTATAVSNTILGVGASLGGRSTERTAQEPGTPPTQADTPPLPPPAPPPAPPPPSPSSSIPPPSSTVVSPN